MAKHVCMTAQLKCSMGAAPSVMVVLPVNRVFTSNQVAATIMDHVPMLNIMPFGMCKSPSNPVVAAATAAALGVLTPMPCIPATPAPWAPGAATVMVGNFPALNDSSKLNCLWAGIIEVSKPGQDTENIP